MSVYGTIRWLVAEPPTMAANGVNGDTSFSQAYDRGSRWHAVHHVGTALAGRETVHNPPQGLGEFDLGSAMTAASGTRSTRVNATPGNGEMWRLELTPPRRTSASSPASLANAPSWLSTAVPTGDRRGTPRTHYESLTGSRWKGTNGKPGELRTRARAKSRMF